MPSALKRRPQDHTSSADCRWIVISQATAIRERDVETVLSKLAELQGEMVQRAQLEQERDGLMKRSAALLRIDPAEVDIDALVTLETPDDAVVALGYHPDAVALPQDAQSPE